MYSPFGPRPDCCATLGMETTRLSCAEQVALPRSVRDGRSWPTARERGGQPSAWTLGESGDVKSPLHEANSGFA